MDAAIAADHAVARDDLAVHAEVLAAVGDELVELLERGFIEEELDPLAGGKLAFFMLPFAAVGAATGFGGGVTAA
jgi:hypothetical protein